MISVNWQSLHSMGELREFNKLDEWAKTCYDNGGTRALEIGSFHGKSTALLAQYFEPVYAVDLWGNVDDGVKSYPDIGQHHFISFIKNMIQLKLIDRVIPLVGTSTILNLFPCLGVDFIYIDGSHKYEDVKQDLILSSRHLSKTGVMAMDDYKRPGWGYPPYDPNHPHHGPHDPWSGVARAVDEFLTEYNFEIKEHNLGKVLINVKK